MPLFEGNPSTELMSNPVANTQMGKVVVTIGLTNWVDKVLKWTPKTKQLEGAVKL